MKVIYTSICLIAMQKVALADPTQETNRYSTTQDQVQAWLVTDLDNTVFTPDLVKSKNPALAKQATDGVFYELRDNETRDLGKRWVNDPEGKTPMSKWLGYRFAVNAWNKVISDGASSGEVSMKPVEADIPTIIQALQSKGKAVIGLTAREPELQAATEKTLKDLNIDLTINSPLAADLKWQSPEADPLQTREAIWSKGIMYVGRGHKSENHKGKCFLAWLTMAKLAKPKHVVFIDDRLEHALGMKVELEKAGIPTTSFVYTAIPAHK